MFQGRQDSIKINKIEVFLKVIPKCDDTHNKDTLVLTLEPDADPSSEPKNLVLNPWNGLLRAVKEVPDSDLARKLGNWTLTGLLVTGDRIDPKAIEDILVVCNYSL
jgi:hypothetical protein